MRVLGVALALSLLVTACRGGAHNMHGHRRATVERAQDGSFRPRDADHYDDDGEHNTDFDHEAIIGSSKEAEEYHSLSAEEARKRLGALLPKMDLNSDLYIDRDELKTWILKSFQKLSREEAATRMDDIDLDKDGYATYSEFLRDMFGVWDEKSLNPKEMGDGQHLNQERDMFYTADLDNDGRLNAVEFEMYTNPEEHPEMYGALIKQTLVDRDSDGDGLLNFQEFTSTKGEAHDKEWLISEKDKFDHEYDLNQDGVLDREEIRAWMVPDNNEIASEEVDHLFMSADDDHDDYLSYDEILDHHDVFVGSEATDYGGEDIFGSHFADEL